jgi:Family of unknown function (DUF6148)
MAGITLAHAEAQLAIWLAASTAVATGQEYEIETTGSGRRRLRRADAKAIQDNITFWDQKVKDLTPSTTGGRTTYVVPDHNS